jgi:iron(III) transport system ATP-binding protein
MSLLKVSNLAKTFPGDTAPVVDDLSFEVEQNTIFVLLGPSGCGKTTTLRVIAGFEHLDAGRVDLSGRCIACPEHEVEPQHRGIGYVFQDYALFPHLSVIGNVMYGLRRLPRKQRRERAAEALRTVGMHHMADRPMHDLSGGQQQRVALARSMAPAPKLILLDEPFSNLDAALRGTTRAEVRRLLRESGMTAVLVTHDQEEAMTFGDTLAVMHDGRIEQVGRPEQIYRRPASPFVANFLGRTNLVQARADGEYADTPFGKLRLNQHADGNVVISIRPEHLRMQPPRPGSLPARIMDREFKGHDLTYRIRLGGKIYTVQTDYRCPFTPGDEVHVYATESAFVVQRDK